MVATCLKSLTIANEKANKYNTVRIQLKGHNKTSLENALGVATYYILQKKKCSCFNKINQTNGKMQLGHQRNKL